MTDLSDKTQFSIENRHCNVIDEATKEDLLQNRKAQNTNRATKQWISCLNEFLCERNLPNVDCMDIEDLPKILEEFY